MKTSSMGRFGRVFVARFHPGEDLLASLERLVKENGIAAGAIISMIGSIRKAHIRYYERSPEGIRHVTRETEGSYELLSGCGNFYVSGDKPVVHIQWGVIVSHRGVRWPHVAW